MMTQKFKVGDIVASKGFGNFDYKIVKIDKYVPAEGGRWRYVYKLENITDDGLFEVGYILDEWYDQDYLTAWTAPEPKEEKEEVVKLTASEIKVLKELLDEQKLFNKLKSDI